MAFMDAPSGDGNFKVYVKYNAKAGRWYSREDKPESEDYEVTNMTAIFDMENIRTGRFLFVPAMAPVKHINPDMNTWLPNPGEGFKRGFELDVYSDKNLGGVREFCSTAGAVIEAMNALDTDWKAGMAANPGKLPVVKCIGVIPVTSKHGTNYKPDLKIVAWADRPAELSGKAPKEPTKPAPATAAKPQASKTIAAELEDDIAF